MKKIKVSDMRCVHCEKRINDALKSAGISAGVELASKTVTVENDGDVTAVLEILCKLGFHAE